MEESTLLKQAMNGYIQAFQQLFIGFQPQLKAYLYRLLTDRHDVDDLTQDTFVKAYDKLSTFKGQSTLKTWVFQIATHLALDFLRRRKRWAPNAQDQAKALAMSDAEIQQSFRHVHAHSPYGRYEVREHIDFCFTCISKTLTIEQQVTVILKDMYAFSRKEIALILGKTEGVVKHLLHDGRRIMMDIFDQRCALINKQGVCHQCTELAGLYNPKQAARAALMDIELVRQADEGSQQHLYALRAELVAQIDPLRAPGADFQDILMQCTRQAIGEIDAIN